MKIIVKIANERGLHARASAKFVKCAENFTCEIDVTCKDISVPGTSIMGLMMLGACKGTEISIQATGTDNQKALDVTITALERTDAGQDVDRETLSKALNTCRGWAPKAKETLIEKWLMTVRKDNVVSPAERQLLAILCACIEVPIPDEMLQ